MRYLTLPEVLEIHRRVLAQSGGAPGVRDLGAVESALAQPGMSFGGEDLYPTIADKAGAICFSLVMNHRLSTATDASAMPQWRPFWYSINTNFVPMSTMQRE